MASRDVSPHTGCLKDGTFRAIRRLLRVSLGPFGSRGRPLPRAADRRRRVRIAAGNAQQLARFRGILRPAFRGVAFAFGSGKALRVLMPFCLLWLLVGSALLAPEHGIFAVLFASP